MKTQTELCELPVGLTPLPDETLFSWCSRYHQLAANGHAKNTSIQLFGDARAGLAHDLPSQVAELAVRTRGVLGTASEMIRARTVLDFYLPFKPSELGDQAEASMCGHGIAHLKYRLGLLTSGVGAAHPLKACPACISHDQDTHGWAYWRRSHQLPGVWLCAAHRLPLHTLALDEKYVGRMWILPTSLNCTSVGIARPPGSTLEEEWLTKLGTLSIELISHGRGCFADPNRIAAAFRSRLQSLGLMRSTGRVRWASLSRYLDDLATGLTCLPGLNHESDSYLLRGQLTRFLSGRSYSHPLRNLIWITAWFDNLTDLQAAYDAACGEDLMFTPQEDHSVLAPPPTKLSGPHCELLNEVSRGEISMTAAACRAGVAYATFASWASKERIEVLRRPKKLCPATWSRAVDKLLAGADKLLVASECNIAVVSVTRILRTVPGLQEKWHAVRRSCAQADARAAWKNVSGLFPYLGIKGVRSLEPAAYAWLYRNDREWLDASTKDLHPMLRANHSVRRIELADERMATALKRLASTWAMGEDRRTLAELRRAVPGIGKAIDFPLQWPSTIRALRLILTARHTAGQGDDEFTFALE